MTTHEPLIAGLSQAKLDLLSRLVRDKGHRSPQTKETASPIARAVRADRMPLSFAQERLWFIDQLEPESAAYNVPHAVRLTGSLQVAALEQSVNEMVRRHEVLRTSFVDSAGHPAQQIAPELRVELPLVDLGSLSESDQRVTAERLMREQARRPFDLRRAPLLRVQLVRLAEREHEFLFAMHHIASDGWSTAVLVRELGLLYPAYLSGGQSPLAELAIQYADFALWQRERLQGEVLDAALSYWKQQLAEAPEVLDLPANHARPRLESFRGDAQSFVLSESISRGLRELSQQSGTTLFMTLLAAFKTLLYRYTGQTDIVVGTPVANRNLVEIEPLIGFFVNTLVLRTQVKPEASFREFLQRVREVVLGAQVHQELPFERLVQELAPERSLSHAPLFQVMLVLDNAPARKLELPGLQLQTIGEDSATAKFDLTLVLSNRESGELSGEIKYNAALFDGTTIARLAHSFEATVTAIISDAEQPLRNVQLLSTEQRRQLLTEWNDTNVDFGTARCLDELLEIQVSKTPDALALVYDEQQITFAELNRRANQLAHHLQRLGVGPEVAVALLVERSELALIGIWGILKAGGGYVPLDAAMPAARVAAILEDARPAVLLTQSHLVQDLSDLPRVVLLDRDWEAIANESDEAPIRTTTPENLAYVIYTSGSTGRPKGVAVQHRSLANLSAALKQNIYTSFAAPLRVGLNATLSFDASVKQWLQVVDGHTLEVIPDEVRWDALEFVRYAKAHALDVVDCTPPQLKTLLEVELETSLQAVLVGGDAIDETLWEQLATHPTLRFYNVYGPTECTDVTTARQVSEVTPTIGRPLPNVQTYFLDEYAEPVPFGVRGELCIGGAGVARGYLHQPELTADKFIPDAFGLQPGARLYRSGDSGHYVTEGEIDFIGRVDDQVKVRGYRIEPGEIEAVLAQHAAVRQCKVLVQEVTPGAKRLVAYVVCDEQQQPATNELRAFLKERLPDYMIPAAFVTLAQMPLTPSGKVDRKALPEPKWSKHDELGDEEPRTLVEEILAGVWSDVLGLEQVGVDENFFELGGHSLLAVQVASRVRTALEFELPLRWVFEAPTVRTLAERIAAAQQNAKGLSLPPITRTVREETLPLSFAQERLWFLDQLEPGSVAYNIPHAVGLTGSLQVSVLEQSVNEIARRHEALRTSFVDVAGQPAQQIAAELKLGLPLIDLQRLSTDEQQEQAERLAREEARRPFDLRQAPFVRVRLLRLSEQRHQFLFTMHHIVSDGWSMNVVVRELVTLYEALHAGQPSPLTELGVQYADFALWQREWQQETILAQLDYWKQQLVAAPEVLELPADRPRPLLPSHHGAQQHFLLPASLHQSLKRLSRKQDATLFMTALAAFKTLLYRYTGQADILVGTPVANRNRIEVEPLIGFFVNTLVLRTQLNGETSFSDVLSRVREVVLGAQAHQELPFERLVQELAPERNLSHAPLFQVMLVLDNMPARQLELPALQLQPLREDSATAKFDLTLALTTKHESGELRGVLEYNTDLFDATRMARLAEHFSSLLSAVVEDAEQPLARLPLLTDAEQHRLLVEWNDTESVTHVESCVHEMVAAQSQLTPEVVAVEFEDEALTYAELNARANQLAHYLRRRGVGPEVLVGLCLEPSLELVVGVLGILKAGGAYVPLDPAYPQERLSFMLADSQTPVIVTREQYTNKTDATETICLDRDWSLIAQEPLSDIESGVSPDNLAYVIYTSGSTGRPKGAAIQHRSAVELLCWSRQVFSAEVVQAVLGSTSICFDLSVFELFVPLSRGGKVVLVADALRLPALAGREGVTLINTVPSVMAELLRLGGVPQSVQTINLAGEPLSATLVRQLHEQTNVKRVFDLYGPSEDTTYSTYTLRLPEGPVTIGNPITNTKAYALDSSQELMPSAVAGELYLGGRGLARGYLRRPELTAEKFIPNPFGGGERLYRTGDVTRHLADGRLEYLGRRDHQVKLRGFRIELGEIEAALSAHAGVRENVVVVREQRLVAYVVGVAEQSELRSYLRDRLPQYMVPSAFVHLDALPRLPNGKINRKALPEPERSERERQGDGSKEEQTQLEQLVAGVWCDVLRLEQVGVDENFFELGGHSLLAVQVASRVRTALEFELPLRWVFEAPTVRTLAEKIEAAQQSAVGVSLPPITRRLRAETLPLSFGQERLWFIDQLEPQSAAYNIPGGVQLTGSLQIAALEQSLNETMRRHEALRTRFVDVAGEPAQQIAPELKLGLPLIDLQRLSTDQQQEQAERLVREEARRPFDLRHGPLLRVRLLQLGKQQHQFLFTMHHIVSDGWSMNVAVRELVRLYEALHTGLPSPLTELAVQYADFALWQRQHQEAAVLEQLDYWKQQLAEAPSLDLPTDHRRGSDKKRGAQYPIRIPVTLSNELIAFSRRESITPFMILLAAYQLVLSRYSGQTDISVGTPVAGRDRIEVEELIGFFVNTLVMRTQLDLAWTIRQLLEHVRETALQAHMHRDVQFERLVEELQPERRLDRTPLFQVMLMVQPRTTVNWPGLDPRAMTIDADTAKFDLTLVLSNRESGELGGEIKYNAALFDESTIARLAESFEAALAAIVTDAEQPLRNVQLLTTEQRRQLLTEWNDTNVDFGAARCLDELLEIQVERTPDAIALVYDEQQITYAELNQRANQLAHHLRSLGVGPEVAVALLLERSELALIGIWGILKAGGGYVPLDAAMPSARVAAILEDARPAVLLTQSHLVQDLSDLPEVVLLDRDREAIANESDEAPIRTTTPENLAYVIYTSGSTGKPKGVAVQHRSLANLSAALKQNIYTSFAAPLRVGLNATLSFDASVKQWLQLLDGHTLELFPDEVRWDAREFLLYARAHSLDVVDCTPPQLKTLLEVELETSLQAVLVGGDAIDEALWEQLATHPTLRFYNLYGPTECTDVTTARQVSEVTPTIGRPLPNVQTYFLGEYAEPVPFGVRGELCIGGAGVARGYLHQPELTADKFIPDAFGLQPGARLYRSGDSGRYVAQGEIEFIGRVDDQVKIRGYWIRAGEIEAVLAQHAAVRQCKVLVQEVTPDDKRLVAYVVCDDQSATNELRAFLKERLPDYMIPAAFVTLAQMPLTPSGKVDRKALPKPDQDQREQPLVPPRTPTEQQLADMWSELLGLKQVGIHDNFFDLGGHSLLLTQLASRMRNTMNVELPLRSLFEAPSLMALAERVDVVRQSAAGVSLPPITRARREETLPLSFAQERLWFIDQLEPESTAYNIPRAVELTGTLQVAALEQSLIELIRRHEVLRTSFVSLDGRPVQQIEAVRVEVPLVDLRSLNALEQQKQAERLVREEARRPFDLRQAPLLRAQLVQMSDARHELLFTMHHIVSDGWSTGVLVQEIGDLYPTYLSGAPSSLPELPIQYADFAVWQREHLQGEVLDQELSYWKEQLAGVPEVLELPADHARPRLESFRGERQPLVLSETVSHGLRKLSKQSGTTLFMTLLAAFKALLYRYTGQTDILVGSPIANRNRVEIEPLIGFFVNTLVLRTQLHGESSFRELLQQVRETVLEAQGHQELPFERLVQELAPERSLGHAPLFQVMMVLDTMPARQLELPALQLQPIGEDIATAKFDLTLVLSPNRESGELRGVLEYNTELFDATRMVRLAEHFSSLLSAVVEDENHALARLPLLSAAERHRLLVEWNDTDSAEPPESCVPELFAAQSQLTPEAVALEFEDETLTYAELNARANQLAHYLRKFGVGPDVLVGLCLDRSLELVIGVLGILKAGGAYVPFDPAYPQERLSFMLADSQAPVIVTQEQYTDLTDETRIVCLDRDWSLIAGEAESDIESGVSPDNLAYVMYTSGSTGIPKGVSVNHRAVVRLVQEPNYADLNDSHTFLLLAPVSFDASTLEIWGSLLNGARLAVMSGGTPSLQELGTALRRYHVTTLWLTAGLFNLMVDQQLEDLQQLEQLLTGGDVASVAHVRKFLQNAPGCKLGHAYGPTENTTFTTCHPLTEAAAIEGTVPIGRPITNTRVYILDGELQPVPMGTIGELYTGGDGLARDYFRRASLTAERFIPNPFSRGERLYKTGDQVRHLAGGEVEFIGRADQQVKLRGFRIELGEIEAALSAHPGVRENVVVARQDVPGEKRLVAYVVAGLEEQTASELRSFLREKLPEYMVPSAFVLLDELPLNPNGKVNRKLLPEPEYSERGWQSEEEPETQIAQIVAGIFSDLLGVDQVGLDENFFELGGHSLLAVQVASRVRTVMGVELPLRWVFEAPTVRTLAERIEQSAVGVSLPPITRTVRAETLSLSFAQERLWFIDQLEPESVAYNVPGGIELTGSLQVAALEQSLNETVRRHEALRTSFVDATGQPAQQIAAELKLGLPLIDLQRLSTDRQQEQAERLVREEARRPFDLRHGPLLRVRLLRLSEQQHQFLFTMHHIVSDGWSMNVAVRELVTLYEALHIGQPSPLTELGVQYADFAVWQRQHQETAVLEQLDYWKQQLAAAPTLELPTDHRRGNDKKRLGQYSLTMPAALSSKLMRLAKQEGLTPFMILLAAYQLVLSRYSGQTDISVGTPVAGRDRIEVEELIGFFVNTLVMRTKLDPNWTMREFLKHVRETALQAHMHRDVQFERLVEELQPERRLDRSPLFQVMLIVQPARAAVDWPGLEARALTSESGTAKFDLALSFVHDRNQVSGTLRYNAALFERATIARFTEAFETTLAAMVGDLEQPLRNVQLLSAEQRWQLLTEWNDTQIDFGAARCLDELLEIQVSKTPDALALVYDEQQITFEELNRRANQLAHHLQRLGVGPEVAVALLVERSELALIGIWGVLKAGGGYVPLDAAMPSARVAAILEDARPAVLLTQSHLVQDLSDLPEVVLLDRDWEAIANESDEAPLRRTTPENLAYVIYTSGSTGRPKGVTVQHRSLANLSAALKQNIYTSFAAPLRVGLNATLSFDASVKQWLQLLDGHTLELFPDEVRWDAREFLLYARAHNLDVVDCTPPQLKTLLEVELETSLQAVLVGGDAIDEALWEQLATHPTLRFYNLYGPTECTDVTTAVQINETRPTIGHPLPNVQTYFLDEYAEPVPFGVRGELCIGGAGVARGYLHQPELTADKFIPDAFGLQPGARLYRSGDSGRYMTQGEIEFIGRVDDQVKIRGYRIEPGEIEAVLAQHAAVRQCKVLVQEVTPADKRLVAYIVGEEPPINELRAFLKARLPEYMIPAAFVTLAQMPLTPSGKVDRKALPKPGQDQREQPLVLPRTPTEQQLADMWTELLGVRQVSIHDNFFDLGGHSLLLTQLASRMRNTMNVDVPLRSLFEAPTILEMGQMLSNWQVAQHDPAELAQLLGEIKNLTPQEIQAQLIELN